MKIIFNRDWVWHPQGRPGRVFRKDMQIDTEAENRPDAATVQDLLARGVAREVEQAESPDTDDTSSTWYDEHTRRII